MVERWEKSCFKRVLCYLTQDFRYNTFTTLMSYDYNIRVIPRLELGFNLEPDIAFSSSHIQISSTESAAILVSGQCWLGDLDSGVTIDRYQGPSEIEPQAEEEKEDPSI
ncbi:jg6156 [Pararge aegeria aegeria]|uniref:Jg6156 protein n=1 Tax=Pararge aegeria aegeria TaxID=348720 RepID=A0A8S4RCY5_9NEOP|nr:jg6156 [Pararge aegeria aegeria]